MTKAEEMKLLEQIVDLIQSTPMDSYIRMAFSGVPEYAVRNIEDDGAYNPVEERDMWESRFNVESREHDRDKKLLADAQNMLKEAMRDMEGMQKQIAKLTEERDAMADSCKGLGEIIDDMEKKIRMYETEIAQYARGDVFAEVRLDQTRRVVVIRGLYEKFCVGTQKHITENASCPWDYMTNGWKWEDAEYCNDEEEVKKVFKEIVIAERRKECGK